MMEFFFKCFNYFNVFLNVCGWTTDGFYTFVFWFVPTLLWKVFTGSNVLSVASLGLSMWVVEEVTGRTWLLGDPWAGLQQSSRLPPNSPTPRRLFLECAFCLPSLLPEAVPGTLSEDSDVVLRLSGQYISIWAQLRPLSTQTFKILAGLSNGCPGKAVQVISLV